MFDIDKEISKAITKAVNEYLKERTCHDYKRPTWKERVKASVRIFGYDKALTFFKSIKHRIEGEYKVKPKTLFDYLEKFKKKQPKNKLLDEFFEGDDSK